MYIFEAINVVQMKKYKTPNLLKFVYQKKIMKNRKRRQKKNLYMCVHNYEVAKEDEEGKKII